MGKQRKFNTFVSEHDRVVTFLLSHGSTVLVDSADWANISGHSWCEQRIPNNKHIYASASVDGSKVALHRFLIGQPGAVVDHINGNTLDNRRCNLRLCWNGENNKNRRKCKSAASHWKGVVRRRTPKGAVRWRAHLRWAGKQNTIGLFIDEADAALAYNFAAHHHNGEFTWHNEAEQTWPELAAIEAEFKASQK